MCLHGSRDLTNLSPNFQPRPSPDRAPRHAGIAGRVAGCYTVPAFPVEGCPVIRALYDWTMRLAAHRRAPWTLAAVSFAESSFFPIPPDVMLVPMVLANRQRAWYLALLCTLASALGGLFGYFIGYALFEAVAQPILAAYGYLQKFDEFQGLYNEWGAWIVFMAGFTPFPYKVITIASGLVQMNLPIFLAASVISRGARFFLVAGLLWKFGEPIRSFVEKNLGLLTVLFFVLFVGGFAAVKFVL